VSTSVSPMPTLNRAYVLAPFHHLMSTCQNNVLMGFRLVENIAQFPPPTPEEMQFFQLSFGAGIGAANIGPSREVFKHWVLTNGFEDVHSCLRLTLERLFILKTVAIEFKQRPDLPIQERESDLATIVSKFHFPTLLNEVNALLSTPLESTDYMTSFNCARNSLAHTRGIVTARHCNETDKLVVKGRRFKMFFKRGDLEVRAEMGKPGPENAALLLGAEDFAIAFAVGQAIELSLKQFLDVLNTCVFIHAEIEVRLTNEL
jgi:hypothetical protein